MNKMNKIAAALTLTFAASSTFAGSLGDTSSDTSTVSLEVTDKVQVSNISDIPLGAYNGTDATLTGNASYCVFRNGGDNYRLKLTTDQGGFEVTSPTTTDTIAFSAKIDDDGDASDGTAINYDTFSANMSGSDATDCNSTNNGSVHVTFLQADLLAASSANDYQAVVTVYVEPI